MQLDFNFTQPFYNTIPISGTELKEATESAESQERIIENFFKCNPMNEFTPPVVMEMLDMKCINSCRRAITNLCKKGVLRKTGNKKPGIFGTPNNCWKYNSDNQ